ncbi:alpha/beta fold hydrolase [Celeribacter sp.]|uniref:alpha/beta fold hydrolase n=1 Tax=Celeribacter sp. TaxID=1890673 RepID=UPI003A955E13
MAIDLADGRPWILLPGTLCSERVFRAFLDELCVPDTALQPVALQHPHVEDYDEVLTETCAQGSVVCGFSLGALVAAHLADRLPASTFLLFGLNAHADHPEKREGREQLARDVIMEGANTALAPRLPILAGPEPQKARALLLDMAQETAGQITAQTELALTRPDACEVLARARAPIGLLTGTEDKITPLAMAHTAAQAAPTSRVIPLEGLGHYALVEDPVACASAVANYASQVDTRTHC